MEVELAVSGLSGEVWGIGAKSETGLLLVEEVLGRKDAGCRDECAGRGLAGDAAGDAGAEEGAEDGSKGRHCELGVRE